MDKYLLRRYLAPMIYCLAAFSMVYVVYDLFDHLAKFIEVKTPLILVIRYYLCLLLPTLEYIVPASLLLATLYTLWRLTRNNELTAMRASGVSLYRLMLPFLAVGVTFSLISAVIKETIAPRAQQWATDFSNNGYRKLEHKIHFNQAYYNSTAHRLWLIDKFDLKSTHRLIKVKVTQEREDGSRAKEIFAKKAEWLDGKWWFYDAQVQKYDVHDNPVGSVKALVPGSDTVIEMPSLSEKPSDFVNEVKSWEFFSTREMLHYLAKRPSLSEETIAQKRFDLHSRLAMPWACFIVTLFGIPTGARSGRQTALAGIFLTMLFFFGFYALTQVGMFLGKTQIIWPWLGAWLSNIVFLVAGIGMIRRMR